MSCHKSIERSADGIFSLHVIASDSRPSRFATCRTRRIGVQSVRNVVKKKSWPIVSIIQFCDGVFEATAKKSGHIGVEVDETTLFFIVNVNKWSCRKKECNAMSFRQQQIRSRHTTLSVHPGIHRHTSVYSSSSRRVWRSLSRSWKGSCSRVVRGRNHQVVVFPTIDFSVDAASHGTHPLKRVS